MSTVGGILRAGYERDVTVIKWKFCKNVELGHANQLASKDLVLKHFF
jgi:hypothetical protein